MITDLNLEFRGRVKASPEIRYLPDGTEIIQFTVRAEAEPPENIVVRFPAERLGILKRWIDVNKHVHVKGRLRLVRWTASSGDKRATLLVDAHSIEPLDTRDEYGGLAPDTRLKTPITVSNVVPNKTERVASLRELMSGLGAPS